MKSAEEIKPSLFPSRERRLKVLRAIVMKITPALSFKKESLFSDTIIEKEKNKVKLEKLPPVSPIVRKKYFGETSREMYYRTYQELKNKGKILLGGYEELDGILFRNEENKFQDSIIELEQIGVLTPLGNDQFNETYATNTSLELTLPSLSSSYNYNDDYGPIDTESVAMSPMTSPSKVPKLQEINNLSPSKSFYSNINTEEISPRAIFLNGCLKYGVPPLTSTMYKYNIIEFFSSLMFHLQVKKETDQQNEFGSPRHWKPSRDHTCQCYCTHAFLTRDQSGRQQSGRFRSICHLKKRCFTQRCPNYRYIYAPINFHCIL